MNRAKANRVAGSGATAPVVCERLAVRGLVQGVGFRPFIFLRAHELRLVGTVSNTSSGVEITLEGTKASIGQFTARMRNELPPLARIEECIQTPASLTHNETFSILESNRIGPSEVLISPDIATCDDCLADVRDPQNRRYRYPFTNCTNCGPRYSIIESMPYDRPYTTMASFPMCAECRREYEDPSNRRFHAQPVACPQCGPQIGLWSRTGEILAEQEAALEGAISAITAGQVVALKGLGGFQLLVDASNDDAVSTLRYRKKRADKAFALMYPDIDSLRRHCWLTPAHVDVLQSPQSPIVLIPSKGPSDELAPSIAPDTYQLGVMLPYTPLHHLLLSALARPLVVTSGNLGDEPICVDERDALERLSDVADLFLVHNRPITRQVDDSVVTLIDDEVMVLRRARGYAPGPLASRNGLSDALAVGGHLKNTVSFSKAGTIFSSQHIGDLENLLAMNAFETTTRSMGKLLDVRPRRLVHDDHPDYASTRFAARQGLPVCGVQHHYAHVLSCMAEHGLEGPVLGLSWDGTGYGSDGTIWGGEFLQCTRSGFERRASLRPFRLPGGETAIREPQRSAFGLLYEAYGKDMAALDHVPTLAALSNSACSNMQVMLEKEINSPVTTSMGRLFDGVASLCGLCHRSTYEGQAAMRLEKAALDCTRNPYTLELRLTSLEGRLILDWQELVRQVVEARASEVPTAAIARGFHNALAEGALQIARILDLEDIVLSGGCFQNRLLLQETTRVLSDGGYRVYQHRTVPPNDGGISVGQCWYQPEGASQPCV